MLETDHLALRLESWLVRVSLFLHCFDTVRNASILQKLLYPQNCLDGWFGMCLTSVKDKSTSIIKYNMHQYLRRVLNLYTVKMGRSIMIREPAWSSMSFYSKVSRWLLKTRGQWATLLVGVSAFRWLDKNGIQYPAGKSCTIYRKTF